MKRSLYKAVFVALFSFAASTLHAQKNVKWVESGKVINEGIALHDKESYQDAIEKYKLVNRNDTLYAAALYELALTYKETKEYDKAVETCKEGILLRSGNGPLFYNIYASSLDLADKKEEAIKVFDEGLKRFPLNLNLLINKGITLRRMNRDADAVDVFQRAALINPYYASAHYHLGLVAAKNKKIVPAILSLETFLLLEHQTQRSLSALILLENLAKGGYKVNEDSIVSFHGETGDFSTLETLIESKIALSKQYDLQVKTTYEFIRPIQLVFEKLKYRPADKGFWMQYYVPLYAKLWEEKQFEPFVHYILGTIDNEVVQKNYKKYQPDIKEMLNLAGQQIKSMSKKGPVIKDYAYAGLPHWYTDGYLQAVGNVGSDGETHSGAWTMFSGTGTKLAEGSYQNGKKHGTWNYYRNDGTQSSKEEFTDGKLNGVSLVYSASGVPSMSINYKNGIADGELVTYFPAGQKKSVMQYKADKKNGLETDYHENGQVEAEILYKDGIADGACKFYHNTGGLEYEYNFRNDLRNGGYKMFYPSGKVKVTGNYTDGKRTSEFKTFNEDGSLQESEIFVNDVIEGKNTVYYADGKTPDTEREYKGGKLQRIRYYDEDGLLYRDLTYRDGKLIKHFSYGKKNNILSQSQNNKGDMPIIFHYPGGAKRSEGNVVKGEMDGSWKFYQENGALDVEEIYDDGYRQGLRKEYYNNGKLFEETNYVNGQTDGYSKSYHKSGNLRAEGYYKSGQKEGEWVYYHENGKTSAREYFINNEKTGY
ncbi:MAG: tetratricopeptide repeat protein, partial [Bacteroidia bacterium]